MGRLAAWLLWVVLCEPSCLGSKWGAAAAGGDGEGICSAGTGCRPEVGWGGVRGAAEGGLQGCESGAWAVLLKAVPTWSRSCVYSQERVELGG